MKKRGQRPLPAGDDPGLFQVVVADATPLRPQNRARLEKPPPRPLPEQRWRDERAALESTLTGSGDWPEGSSETGEEPGFLRPGVRSDTLRKLRRAHWRIQGELDLHGLTSPEAHRAVAEFFAACARAGYRCVRIIHGKGLRSPNREPVLKRKLALWLTRRDDVLAYCEARRTEGGSGATLVLLRSREKST